MPPTVSGSPSAVGSARRRSRFAGAAAPRASGYAMKIIPIADAKRQQQPVTPSTRAIPPSLLRRLERLDDVQLGILEVVVAGIARGDQTEGAR